ncbi:MAG: hypothetical protein A2902_06495 [Elusimicrobia bacterium RIFCSPLOWO2_01_FULL_64_13]|nr:MAG: hypothetical protein A2902_06495 [Elusimicrobia bacterium RIFCSPLOWO2_01_FULL_64_13]
MKGKPSAGVIAAGEGSRFRRSGVATAKPLIPVGGLPLVGHVLRNFSLAGIGRAVVIFNESEEDCVRWVRRNPSGLELEIIVKSTKSSFESFWRVGRALGPGDHLISTVDALCAPEDLKKVLEEPGPADLVLGLTRRVEDEKPLWVEWDAVTGAVSRIGPPAGREATAGIYRVSDSLFREAPAEEFPSLRAWLKRTAEAGAKVRGVLLGDVFDVDDPSDLKAAEDFFRRAKTSS